MAGETNGLINDYLTDEGLEKFETETLDLGIKDFKSEFENAYRQAKRIKAQAGNDFKSTIVASIEAIKNQDVNINYAVDLLMDKHYDKEESEKDIVKIAEVYFKIFGTKIPE